MAEYPTNDFTKMIEAVASGNRSGQFGGGGVASAIPLPSVQSADLGREVPMQTFAPGEREELDRLAREAGVVDPRVGSTVTEATNYATLEEAMAAGESVKAPPPPTSDPTMVPVRLPVGAMVLPVNRLVPTVPDFNKVEGIDLVTGRVVLGGMDFPLPEEKVRELKRLVIETAQAAIMEKMQAALQALAIRVEQAVSTTPVE
jgi:hypothetical protein